MICNQSCKNKGNVIADACTFFRILGYLRNKASIYTNSQEVRNFIYENLKNILKLIAECSIDDKILVEDSIYNDQINILNASSRLANNQEIFGYYNHHGMIQEIADIFSRIIKVERIIEQELEEFKSQFSADRSDYIKHVGSHDLRLLILAVKQSAHAVIISQDSNLRAAARELFSKNIVQIQTINYKTDHISSKPLEDFLSEPYSRCKIEHAEYQAMTLGLIAEMANSLANGNRPASMAILQSVVDFSGKEIQDAYIEKESNRGRLICPSGLTI